MSIFKKQLDEVELLDSFISKHTENSFTSIQPIKSTDFSLAFRSSNTFGETLSGERWVPQDGMFSVCLNIKDALEASGQTTPAVPSPLTALSDSFIYYNDTTRPVYVNLCLSFWYNKSNKYGYVKNQPEGQGLYSCPYTIEGKDIPNSWDEINFFEKGAELLLFDAHEGGTNYVSSSGYSIPKENSSETFLRDSLSDINKNNLLLEGCYLYNGISLVPPLRYSINNNNNNNISLTYYYDPKDPSKIDIFTSGNKSFVVPKNEYLNIIENTTGVDIYSYLNSYRQGFIDSGIYSNNSVYDTTLTELVWAYDENYTPSLTLYSKETSKTGPNIYYPIHSITYTFSSDSSDSSNTEASAEKVYIKTFSHIVQPSQIIVKPKNYYSNVISYSITKL